MSTTVDLQSIRNNQNLARQMLASISNAGVNAVNAYLALRALGYAEPTTAQNLQMKDKCMPTYALRSIKQ